MSNTNQDNPLTITLPQDYYNLLLAEKVKGESMTDAVIRLIEWATVNGYYNDIEG